MKLFLVGGFLGSGKTTAIQKASTMLLAQGRRVGVITNDQGGDLVDSRFIRDHGVPFEQVVDGCFCCRFDQLKAGVDLLEQTASTEVVFAESVGSCTDMIATIVKPFERIDSSLEIIVSVYVDATLFLAIMKGEEVFVESVNYIYHKQIGEADVLVVNKIDLLDAEELDSLARLIEREYPDKIVAYQNSLDEQSVESWFRLLTNFKIPVHRTSLELNYDFYAAGEAALAWLDQEVIISSPHRRAVKAAILLIDKIYTEISKLEIPIGHLKFYLDNGLEQLKISYTAVGYTHMRPDVQMVESKKLRLLINARVQGDSHYIRDLVEAAMNEIEKVAGCEIVRNNVSAFHPGYPRPTHRILD